MTPRRAKRYINTSNDWIVFTNETKNGEHLYRVLMSGEEAWEILLNLSINQYPIRETLRNILKLTDEYIRDNPNNPE